MRTHLAPGVLIFSLFLSAAALAAAPALPAQASRMPGAPGFVGSEKCAECHGDEHAAWQHDWHARALSPAVPPFVVGSFANAHFKGTSSEAWMRKDGARCVMRTVGPTGQVADFGVDWVVGGKRMQDTVTVFPDGRWQVLPVYFHVTGKGEWVDYTETKQGAITPDHPFFWTNFRRMSNRECLDCHTTGLDVRFDRASRTWSTHFADAGVACESCHGPGARHAESQLPKDIVRPSKLPREAQLALCGQCHGPRSPLFPLIDSAHRFRPGELYDAKYQALVVVDGRSRSGDFFPDGRPKTSSFEYQALIQSRCFMKGGATCLICHTAPHAKHGADELPLPGAKRPGPVPIKDADTASCGGCHANLFAQRAQHSHHASAAAQSCTACHMPKVITGVLDTLADHALDVPNPQNTLRHGIPNACNACHVKSKPEDMATAIARWWPKASERQARRLRLADAIDETTAEHSRPALEAVLADSTEAPSLRATAAQLLAQRFSREAAPALVPLLGNPDPLIASAAAGALSLTQARGAADAVAPLLQSPSVWVRQAAALTLASFGDRRGEQGLWSLASDPATAGLVQPHYALGVLAARRGDLGVAASQLDQALDLAPYSTDALVGAADVAMKRGDARTARARLMETLDFDPQHHGALERLRRMGPPLPQ